MWVCFTNSPLYGERIETTDVDNVSEILTEFLWIQLYIPKRSGAKIEGSEADIEWVEQILPPLGTRTLSLEILLGDIYWFGTKSTRPLAVASVIGAAVAFYTLDLAHLVHRRKGASTSDPTWKSYQSLYLWLIWIPPQFKAFIESVGHIIICK